MHSLAKHLQEIQKHKCIRRTEDQKTATQILESKSESNILLRGKQTSFFLKELLHCFFTVELFPT